MNHIKQLQETNKAQAAKIEETKEVLNNLLRYYSSEKFRGHANDYAHVSTDILPRLEGLKNML